MQARTLIADDFTPHGVGIPVGLLCESCKEQTKTQQGENVLTEEGLIGPLSECAASLGRTLRVGNKKKAVGR